MATFNCESCDFIIYNEFENDCHIINVELDYDFIVSIVSALEIIYFNHYLKIVKEIRETDDVPN